MKCFRLVTLAGALMLGGCASTNPHPNDASAKAEDNYIPIGTFIPRKSANPADGPVIANKQALENDRTMGSVK